MRGILLFGHGARNAEWRTPFDRIAASIQALQPTVKVAMGFLELMRPTFDEAVEALVAAQASEIVVVPIFMAAGSHVRKDLPLMAAAAMDRHAGLRIVLAAPVGESSDVIQAMAVYALSPIVGQESD